MGAGGDILLRHGTYKMQRLRQRCFDVGSFVPTLRLSRPGDIAKVTESGPHDLPALRLSLRRQGERTPRHRRGFHLHHPGFAVSHPRHHLLHLHGVSAVLLRLWQESTTVTFNNCCQILDCCSPCDPAFACRLLARHLAVTDASRAESLPGIR